MTYCAQCGYALKEGTSVCPACGTKSLGGEAVVHPVEIQPEPCAEPEEKTTENTVYAIPEPVSPPSDEPSAVKTGYGDNAYPTGRYAPMSVGGYVLFSLLYLIPVLGLVIAAITAIASKKTAKKRFAVSAVIVHLLLLLSAVGLSAALYFGGAALLDTLKELVNL